MHCLPGMILLCNCLSCSNLEAPLFIHNYLVQVLTTYTYGPILECKLELFDHAQGFIPPSTLPAYAGAVARHHPTAPPVSATVGRDHTAHAAEPASVTPPQMLGQPQPSQSAAYGQARGDSPGSFPASTSPLVLPAVPGSIKDSGGDWRLGGAAADNSEPKSVGYEHKPSTPGRCYNVYKYTRRTKPSRKMR